MVMILSSVAMENAKAHLAQVLFQAQMAGLIVITRAGLLHSMNPFVFFVYRHFLALTILSPLAFYFERKKLPRMTPGAALLIFLVGLSLTTSQNIYTQGLYYASSTIAAAATNVLPVCTLAMVVALGQEKMDLRSLRGQAKLWGTLVCVGGGVIISTYKGASIHVFPKSSKVVAKSSREERGSSLLLGCILLFGCMIIWSAAIIFQGAGLKRYPAKLTSVTLICFVQLFLSVFLAVILEYNKPKVWYVAWNIELLAIFYSAIVSSALGLWLQGWTVKKRGAVFTAVYSPLSLLITAFLDFFIFQVTPTWGSMLGALLIVIGLYLALWGKATDKPTETKEVTEGTSRNGDVEMDFSNHQNH